MRRAGVGLAALLLVAAGGLAWKVSSAPRLLHAPAVLRVRHYEAMASTAARVLWRAGPVGARVNRGQKVVELEPVTRLETARPPIESQVAPFDGTVIEIRAAPGDVAGMRTPVLVMAERGAIEAEATVPEEQAEALHEGAPVVLRLRGRNASAPVQGRVAWLAAGEERAVAVRIRLDAAVDPGAGGLDGLPCDATIRLDGQQR